MEIIGKILIYGGLVALIVGYLGVVLCGFTVSIARGVRNLFLPFLGFGDARRRFHFLIWLWGGGIAAILIGSIFV